MSSLFRLTGVSLVVSDKAPRQESHHQRCGTESLALTNEGRGRRKSLRSRGSTGVTCFPDPAGPYHSHLDDPAEGRVFGRGTLRDRRHVVDETHFLYFCPPLRSANPGTEDGKLSAPKGADGSLPERLDAAALDAVQPAAEGPRKQRRTERSEPRAV